MMFLNPRVSILGHVVSHFRVEGFRKDPTGVRTVGHNGATSGFLGFRRPRLPQTTTRGSPQGQNPVFVLGTY